MKILLLWNRYMDVLGKRIHEYKLEKVYDSMVKHAASSKAKRHDLGSSFLRLICNPFFTLDCFYHLL